MKYLENQEERVRRALDAGHELRACMPLKFAAQTLFADRTLRRLQPRSALEVGCGGSLVPSLMANAGVHSVAIDRAAGSLRYQKMIAESLDANVAIHQVDGFNLPFADHEFDVVTSVGLIEHFSAERQRDLFRELLRVTRRELILGVPNYEPTGPFYPIYLTCKDSHEWVDFADLAESSATRILAQDGRGVVMDKTVNRSAIHARFLSHSMGNDYRDYTSTDVELLIDFEASLSAEQRWKYGFIKLVHYAPGRQN